MNDLDFDHSVAAQQTVADGEIFSAATLPPEDDAEFEKRPKNEKPDALTIDGADILYRIYDFTRRFISYPTETSNIAHVLWIAHTHLMDSWFTTARLAVLSPEPGSGKSRVLEISKLLVPNPVLAVNSSAAYIMRKLANQSKRPTILFDEIDTIFGAKGRGNEDLRGLINAGYRRGATVGKCVEVKGNFIEKDFDTYGAIAMGGLGDLPDTIMSRSIIIRMKKRENGEHVEEFRPRWHEQPGTVLRDELAAWAASVAELAESEPVLPDGIKDRHADVWSPLLRVAELAGGRWPELARQAAIDSVTLVKTSEQPSLTVRLLTDIRTCFGSNDRMTSAEIVEGLLVDEESPWGDLTGRKINPRILAQMLRGYDIGSSSIRLADGSTPKGYMRWAFEDTWRRYLPTIETAATSATDATNQ
jgi:hypothetical protein